MISELLGIDVSYWQGEIDWSIVGTTKYKFAVIRATVGDYLTDPFFASHWSAAKDVGIYLSAYHVVIPTQSILAQMDHFFDVLGDRKNDLPLKLVVELSKKPGEQESATPEEIAEIVRQCADIVEERNGRKPIIYTGAWFWNSNVPRSDEWSEYDLWVANYGVTQPLMPLDWDEWLFWQYSDSGNVPGVSAAHTDLNKFNGSIDEFLFYLNSETPVNPVDLSPTQLTGVVTVPAIKVRQGPGKAFKSVHELSEGDKVEIIDIAGRNAWGKVGDEQWVPVKLLNNKLIVFE